MTGLHGGEMIGHMVRRGFEATNLQMQSQLDHPDQPNHIFKTQPYAVAILVATAVAFSLILLSVNQYCTPFRTLLTFSPGSLYPLGSRFHPGHG